MANTSKCSSAQDCSTALTHVLLILMATLSKMQPLSLRKVKLLVHGSMSQVLNPIRLKLGPVIPSK